MTSEIHPSQEDLEKNLLLTIEDWRNTLIDWSGNQKDTECGIHTRIHTDAGSVTLSLSANRTSQLSLYLKMTTDQPKNADQQE